MKQVAAQAGQQAELIEIEIEINTAYCIAKKEMAFTTFRPMLPTQKNDGLQINPTYGKCPAKTWIGTIADTIREEG